MKSLHIIRYAAVAAAALALAACGAATAQHPAASHPATHTAAPFPPSAQAKAGAAAKANDRAFAYGEAASVIDAGTLRGTVAGPVMVPYVRFQAAATQAAAASGSPIPAQSVTPVPGGYNLCGDDGNGGTSCVAYTAFQHNAAGRITGVSVGGQPVAGRIATGPDNTGSTLAITNVEAYRVVSSGQVDVTFTVKNISSAALTGSPPFLAIFNPTGGGQFNEDDNSSILPGSLQPGESAAAVAVFDTHAITGTFSLRTNDGYESVLTSTTLSTVAR
jgi:hypothetical protein